VRQSRLAISFDHFIGAGKQRRRDDEAKCLGSLKVDDQLELGRLLDGQVDRLNAGKDFSSHRLRRDRAKCPVWVDAVEKVAKYGAANFPLKDKTSGRGSW
jgi:hypothetical protein